MIGHLGTIFVDIAVRDNLAAQMSAAGKVAQANAGGMASGITSSLNTISTKCAAISKSFAAVGMSFTKYVTLPVAALGVVGIKEFLDMQKATAQLNAVLKSTGGIANVSQAHVKGLADKMMRLSGVDDEAAIGMESMLLTFTKIRNTAGAGNDIFDQTTRATLDMATAMNGGATPSAEQLRGTAIRLGKAIQDPVLGITALKRVGVNFSAEQKEMIKGWVEHGDTLRAQKYILKELNTEFGRSAEMSGKTVPGQLNILKETFKNTMGHLVEAAIPSLRSITIKLQELVAWFDTLSAAQKENYVKWALIAAAIGPVILVFSKLIGVVGSLASGLSSAITGVTHLAGFLGTGGLAAFAIAAAVLAGLAASVYFLTRNFDGAQSAMQSFSGFAMAIFKPVWEAIKTVWEQLKKSFNDLLRLLGTDAQTVLRAIGIAWVVSMVVPLATVATALILVINVVTATIRVFTGLAYVIKGSGQMLAGFWSGNTELMRAGFSNTAHGVKEMGDGIKDGVNNTINSVKTMGSGMIGAFREMVAGGGKAAKDEGNKQGREAGGAFNSSFAGEAKKTKVQKTAEIATQLKDVTAKDIAEAKVKLKMIADSWRSIQSDVKRIDTKSVDTATKLVKLVQSVAGIIGQMKALYSNKGMNNTTWMSELRTAIRAFIQQVNWIENSLKTRKIDPKTIASFKNAAKGIKEIAGIISDVYHGAYAAMLTPQGGGAPPKMETGWMDGLRTAIRNFGRNVDLIERSLAARDINPKKIESFKKVTGNIKIIAATISDIYKNAYSAMLTPDEGGGGKPTMQTAWMNEMRSAIKNFIQNVNMIENSLVAKDIDPKKIATFLAVVKNLKVMIKTVSDIKREATAGLADEKGQMGTGWIAGVKAVFRELGSWLQTVPNMQKNSMQTEGEMHIPHALTPFYQRLSTNIKEIFRSLGLWLQLVPMWQKSSLLLNSPVIPGTLDLAFVGMGEHIKGVITNFSSSWLVHVPQWFHNTLIAQGDWMAEAGKNLATRLINAVKERLGIHSPSDAFRDIGKNMILGLLQGLNFEAVMQVMDGAFGGFEGFAWDLFQWMQGNMGKGIEWMTGYLGVTNVQGLYDALQAMFNPVAAGGGAGLTQAIFNYIQEHVPGNQVASSMLRPGSTVAGSGRQSLHATGQAVDITGAMLDQVAVLAGQIIGIPGYSAGVGKSSFGEVLWRTMVGGNHFTHVHVGARGVSPFMQANGISGGAGMNLGALSGSIQQMIAQAATSMGWGGQLGSLMQLIARESGFNPAADNPSSTAYGLFQMLTETNPNPAVQIANGLNYIRGRYGDPNNAWNFWQGHRWYQGGGAVSATLHDGERVLTNQQNRWFTGLARPLANLTKDSSTVKVGGGNTSVKFPAGTTFKIANLREGIIEVVEEGVYDHVKKSADIEEWTG